MAMILFTITLAASIAPPLLGSIMKNYDISPDKTPKEYGQFLAYASILPALLAIPCFYMSGLRFRDIKMQQRADGVDNEVTQLIEKHEAQFDKFGGRELDQIQYNSRSINLSKQLSKNYDKTLKDIIMERTMARSKIIDKMSLLNNRTNTTYKDNNICVTDGSTLGEKNPKKQNLDLPDQQQDEELKLSIIYNHSKGKHS